MTSESWGMVSFIPISLASSRACLNSSREMVLGAGHASVTSRTRHSNGMTPTTTHPLLLLSKDLNTCVRRTISHSLMGSGFAWRLASILAFDSSSASMVLDMVIAALRSSVLPIGFRTPAEYAFSSSARSFACAANVTKEPGLVSEAYWSPNGELGNAPPSLP